MANQWERANFDQRYSLAHYFTKCRSIFKIISAMEIIRSKFLIKAFY